MVIGSSPQRTWHFTILTKRFDDARFASSLLGVARLPAPQLLVMLEATALN